MDWFLYDIDLRHERVKYAVVQFSQKKTFLTENCCVFLVFIFSGLVWSRCHIIKQIFHAFFLFDIEIIHPR